MEETGEVQERILTLTNYDEENGKTIKRRVTISPHSVEFTMADDKVYDVIDGRDIQKVIVVMVSGNNLELYISSLDLAILERVVGNYFLP